MPTPRRPTPKRAVRPDLSATPEPSLVRVPPARCLAVAGTGDPGGDRFQRAIGALYGVAWTIKMTRRTSAIIAIGPLEGLWWGGAPGDGAAARRRWRWKLLLRLDPAAGARDVAAAVRSLEERGRGDGAREVEVEVLREGTCVQALHVGPYSEEPETLRRMGAFAAERKLAYVGAHHEIYLADPRRTAPDRLRTILRHPVRRAVARRPRRV